MVSISPELITRLGLSCSGFYLSLPVGHVLYTLIFCEAC
jgi:hypothetical protein